GLPPPCRHLSSDIDRGYNRSHDRHRVQGCATAAPPDPGSVWRVGRSPPGDIKDLDPQRPAAAGRQVGQVSPRPQDDAEPDRRAGQPSLGVWLASQAALVMLGLVGSVTISADEPWILPASTTQLRTLAEPPSMVMRPLKSSVTSSAAAHRMPSIAPPAAPLPMSMMPKLNWPGSVTRPMK